MRIFIDPYPHWSCGAALKKLHKDKQTNDNKLETRTTTRRIKHGDHDQDPSAYTSPKKLTNSPTPSPQGVIIPSHGVQCLVKKLRIQVVFSFKNHALLQRDAHSRSILCALTTCETTAIEPPTDLFTEVEKKQNIKKNEEVNNQCMVPTILLFHKNVYFDLSNRTKKHASEFSFRRSNCEIVISFVDVKRKDKNSENGGILSFWAKLFFPQCWQLIYVFFSISPKQLFEKIWLYC